MLSCAINSGSFVFDRNGNDLVRFHGRCLVIGDRAQVIAPRTCSWRYAPIVAAITPSAAVVIVRFSLAPASKSLKRLLMCWCLRELGRNHTCSFGGSRRCCLCVSRLMVVV